MFCYKCGEELPEGSHFCKKCGAKIGKAGRNNVLITILAIVAVVVALVALVISIISAKTPKKAEDSDVEKYAETATDYRVSDQNTGEENGNTVMTASLEESDETYSFDDDSSDFVINKEAESGPNDGILTDDDTLDKTENNEKDDSSESTLLELPSLEDYSKGRMTRGTKCEDSRNKCFTVVFDAGEDTSVVQCIAEYKDLLQNKFESAVTGTLSLSDGDYNCTCYMFTYNGDAAISKGTINFNNCGTCDFCFVTATKAGEGKITAYIPEEIGFAPTNENMRNSY